MGAATPMQFHYDTPYAAERVRQAMPGTVRELHLRTGIAHTRLAECLEWLAGQQLAVFVNDGPTSHWRAK